MKWLCAYILSSFFCLLFVCLFVLLLFVCLFVCLFACFFVCLFVCLFVVVVVFVLPVQIMNVILLFITICVIVLLSLSGCWWAHDKCTWLLLLLLFIHILLFSFGQQQYPWTLISTAIRKPCHWWELVKSYYFFILFKYCNDHILISIKCARTQFQLRLWCVAFCVLQGLSVIVLLLLFSFCCCWIFVVILLLLLLLVTLFVRRN